MPKHDRAGLNAADDLANAHAPLAGRKPVARQTAEEPTNLRSFPSLSAPPKIELVSKSYRIPKKDAEQISIICSGAGIDESKLVRDFISAGLRLLAEESNTLK